MKSILISFVIIYKQYFFNIFINIGYNSLIFVNYIPSIKSKLIILFINIKLGSIKSNNVE
jgi:hypothetical protein